MARRRTGTPLLLAALLLAAGGCRPRPQPESRGPTPPPAAQEPAGDEFSVMTYNLLRYSMEDRDRDGQRNDPKPPEERAAVIDLIASRRPDVLAVQELGGPAMLEDLKQGLAKDGLSYDFEAYLQTQPEADYQLNLAVLSRLPIVSTEYHTNDTYTIGKAKHIPVARGFIDVDVGVNPAYRFKLMVAHLKSKVYSPLGQTEMRRNEARLLNKHIRAALKENPRLNLLVVGDMNDTYDSRAVREVMGNQKRYLIDLRPKDKTGDVWTHFRRKTDEYSRIDYCFVSPGMQPEVVADKTRVVRDPLTYTASDHRPVYAVFKGKDLSDTD